VELAVEEARATAAARAVVGGGVAVRDDVESAETGETRKLKHAVTRSCRWGWLR
jgi:hypothetical protein